MSSHMSSGPVHKLGSGRNEHVAINCLRMGFTARLRVMAPKGSDLFYLMELYEKRLLEYKLTGHSLLIK